MTDLKRAKRNVVERNVLKKRWKVVETRETQRCRNGEGWGGVREDKTNINRKDKSQTSQSQRWVKIERSKRPMRRRKRKNSRRKP